MAENKQLSDELSDLRQQLNEALLKLEKQNEDELDQVAMLETVKENLLAEIEQKDNDRINTEKEELKTRTQLNKMKADFDLITLQNEQKSEQVEMLKVCPKINNKII